MVLHGRIKTHLAATALFIAAGLMFFLQPMTGTMLLPLVGGAPSGWVVSMAFYQLALLVGYALSHTMSRLNVRQHGLVFTAILAVSALWLPPGLATRFAPDSIAHPIQAVLMMLTGGIGIPFVILATSSATFQRLYAESGQPDAHDPYFLYSASNLGSLIGLILYPLLIQPALALQQQQTLWSGLFVCLVVLAGICTLYLPQKGAATDGAVEEKPDPVQLTNRQRGLWILLSALPASLSLGVTTKITTDIISLPLIWVLPLSLYLGTMMLAFGRTQRYRIKDIDQIGLFLGAWAIILNNGNFFEKRFSEMFIHLVGFGFLAMSLHHRLASLRPHKSRLTEYYLLMATGGALGGSFNAFLAPAIFHSYHEYSLAMLGALGIIVLSLPKISGLRKTHVLFAAWMILTGFGLYMKLYLPKNTLPYLPEALTYLSLAMLIPLIFAPRILLVALIIMTGTSEISRSSNLLASDRSFFGLSRIKDVKLSDGRTERIFIHGTTIHGAQIVAPETRIIPLAYYAPNSPASDFINALAPHDVAVIGLGVGAMACYRAPDRQFTFYEIDNDVVRLAREWFSYLSACGNPPIIIGDGRLALKHSDRVYDMIIMDAFTSDNIPAHLLTREALATYLDHLTPDGVLAFHISNRYFDLVRPLASLARMAGLHIRGKWWKPSPAQKQNDLAEQSLYLVMAHSPEKLAPLSNLGWADIIHLAGESVWRDDYTDVLSALQPLNYSSMSLPATTQLPAKGNP